jgi:protein-tyrosine phosphatase
MKIAFRIFLVLTTLLLTGYAFVSRENPIIDRGQNPAGINNLHLIDQDTETGFAIYRLGQPDADDIEALCELGIQEIAVLAGTAADYEVAHAERCPSLEIVYDHEDDLSPLTADWLASFDAWVNRAKASGKKIAFRCSCGCHRTGRLAAYYQIKYRSLPAKDAWHLALARGDIMYAVDYFSSLQEQILALEEFIQRVPCTYGEHCVVTETTARPPCPDPSMGCGWKTPPPGSDRG